jgi:hypothetical protein
VRVPPLFKGGPRAVPDTRGSAVEVGEGGRLTSWTDGVVPEWST